jgi:hypothetical protein
VTAEELKKELIAAGAKEYYRFADQCKKLSVGDDVLKAFAEKFIAADTIDKTALFYALKATEGQASLQDRATKILQRLRGKK